jgi:hypothetical protein
MIKSQAAPEASREACCAGHVIVGDRRREGDSAVPDVTPFQRSFIRRRHRRMLRDLATPVSGWTERRAF